MDILNKLIFALMLLSAVGIVILVLLQHGKGADMGTGFGAGASGSLFGATGSANFLSRTTAVLAALFFCTTLALSWFSSHNPRTTAAPSDLLPRQVIPAQKADNPPAAPEAPAGAAPAPAQPSAPAGKAGEIPK